jgi:hypothetical protein
VEYEQQQREIEERARREREAQEAKPALANPGALDEQTKQVVDEKGQEEQNFRARFL